MNNYRKGKYVLWTIYNMNLPKWTKRTSSAFFVVDWTFFCFLIFFVLLFSLSSDIPLSWYVSGFWFHNYLEKSFHRKFLILSLFPYSFPRKGMIQKSLVDIIAMFISPHLQKSQNCWKLVISQQKFATTSYKSITHTLLFPIYFCNF